MTVRAVRRRTRPRRCRRRRWPGPAIGAWSSSMGRAAYVAAVHEPAGSRSPRAPSTRRTSAGSCQAQLPRRTPTSSAWPDASPPATPRRTRVCSLPDHGRRGRQRLAGAVPAPRRRPDRVRARSRAPADAGGHGRQGRGRERDDRRPRPQRPRPRVPDRLGDRARPARGRAAPRPGAPRVDGQRASCAPGVGWPELLDATFPPGSVTGAPKSTALRSSTSSSRCRAGAYCGAVGWVDARRRDGRPRRGDPHVLRSRTAC